MGEEEYPYLIDPHPKISLELPESVFYGIIRMFYLNHPTQHWHTGSTREHTESV